MNDVPPLRQAPPPKKRNWLIIGCLGTVAVVGLLIAAIGIGGWLWFRSLTSRYLSDEPQLLPAVALTSDESLRLEEKLRDVYRAFQQNEPVELELNAAELNATLADNAGLEERVWLEIRDGRLHGKVSIPLDESGLKSLEGRWLNGDATLDLTASAGDVSLTIEDITVNGTLLPGPILEGLRSQNFLEDMASEGEAAGYIRAIEQITFAGDRLRVRFRPAN